jgi:hypothetical protein
MIAVIAAGLNSSQQCRYKTAFSGENARLFMVGYQGVGCIRLRGKKMHCKVQLRRQNNLRPRNDAAGGQQSSAVRCSAVQCGAVQCSAVQCVSTAAQLADHFVS